MPAKSAVTKQQREITMAAGKFVRTNETFEGKTVYNVEIESIRKEEFVRVSLSPERVEHFEICLKTGDKLPPIELTYEGVLIAGRHRIAAYQRIGQKVVPAVFENCSDEDELLTKAILENYKHAPLPLAPVDFAMIFRRQVEKEKSIKELEALFPFMPKKQIAFYFERATDTINKRKIIRAVDLISEKGMSLEKAAIEAGVAPSLVRSALSTKSKKQSQTKIQITNAKLTNQARANSRAVAKMFRELFKEMEMGTVLPIEVSEELKHWEDLNYLQTKNLEEFRTRFNRRVSGEEIESMV